jgi:hypothetical protein
MSTHQPMEMASNNTLLAGRCSKKQRRTENDCSDYFESGRLIGGNGKPW